MKLLSAFASLFTLTKGRDWDIGSHKIPPYMAHVVYCEACLHIIDHLVTNLHDESEPHEIEYHISHMCDYKNFGADFIFTKLDMYDTCDQIRIDWKNDLVDFIPDMDKSDSDENKIDMMNKFCGFNSITNSCKNVQREDPNNLKPLHSKIQFFDPNKHDEL